MRAERGQVLVLLLVLMGALVATLSFVFDHARHTVNQRRLIDSADAAVLSAAVWQARVLNYESYLNRAMIANEVAIAQAVTLQSWIDYMARTTERASLLAQFLPYVGPAAQRLRSVMRQANAAAQPALLAAEAALSGSSLMLGAAGEALHAAALPAALELARSSLAQNYPGARIDRAGEGALALHATQWARAFTRYEGLQRARQKDLVLRSLDRFVRQRGSRFDALVLVKLEKRGGTDLLGFDTWRGLDTFALHRRDFFGWRETLGIGWGAAEQGRRTGARGEHGGSWRTNPRTSRNAERSLRRSSIHRGLPGMRDIARPGERRGEPLRFALSAVAPADGPSAVQYRAVAAAQVLHARPQPRRDRREEIASLFSPYWQARLAPVPQALEVIP